MIARRALTPYLWLAPVLAVLLGLMVYPWLWSLYLSLYRWNPLKNPVPAFVGLGNYLAILGDAEFYTALKNTVLLTVITVSLEFVLGFGLALLLNTNIRGRAFFRTACLVPMMLTPSIVGLAWKVLLHDEMGLVNWVLGAVGIGPQPWMSSPSYTLLTVSIIQVWQHVPFVMLIMLAGLQAVPTEPMEAARVDGASEWQVFWNVVLPWLKPLIMIVLMFRVIFAIRSFDTIFGLWQGAGPVKAGLVVGVYLYEQVRVFWELGKGAAISYVLLALTIAFSLYFTVRLYRGLEDSR